jgi:pimeloyl-ACP methyl ester carboxylesterase
MDPRLLLWEREWIAVGHSYGEALITNPATNAKNSVLTAALVLLQYPTGQRTETAVEVAVNPAQFHDAADRHLSPRRRAGVLRANRGTRLDCGRDRQHAGHHSWDMSDTLLVRRVTSPGRRTQGFSALYMFHMYSTSHA